MIEVHAETRVVKFATLSTAVNYLEDARRQVRKANDALGKVYIVDTGAKANYTAPHPNDPRKAPIFVRAGVMSGVVGPHGWELTQVELADMSKKTPFVGLPQIDMDNYDIK